MLIIVGAIELAILIFCLTISIIVLVTITDNQATNLSKNGQFIGTLQNTPVLFFCTIVLPLFIILVVDGVYLIVYSTRRQSALGNKEKEAIQEEAKRQAREELLKQLREEANGGEEPKE